MEHRIKTPASAEELKKLRAGDTVLLTGKIYTSRDAGHRRFFEMLDRGEEAPYLLSGSAVYYVGPTPERPGEVIGSAGPTTAGRMDSFAPRLLDMGQKIMIGKGSRSAAVKEAIMRNGAVYLGAVGGAGALMASSVRSSSLVCWEDLGCEALSELYVEDMPLTVIIDSEGGDLYELGPQAYLNSL